MKFLKYLLNTIIVLTITGASLFWYMGFFDTVYITEKSTGPYYAVVQEVKLFDNPTDIRNSLFQRLLVQNIVSKQGIAISAPPFDKLNSTIVKTGWIIEKNNLDIIERSLPNSEIIKIKQKVRIAADFPYKNTFSLIGGTYKSYNAMLNLANHNGYTPTKVFELYDDNTKTIFYLMEYK